MTQRKNSKPEAQKKATPTTEEPSTLQPVESSEETEAVKPIFPIIGIGASAGGLAAFEEFFTHMPELTSSGMALVLVQHLAPDHESLLTELIRRYTRMQVYEVEDGMVIQPNCAYIIPPAHDMAILDGKLHLLEPIAPHGLRLPIDYFFRSLAQDQGERAICIVLSGTGSDGALGVRAVKEAGGIAMAQTLDSTAFDGMPQSAINTGLVDYVLPPAEMPAQLIAYVDHVFSKVPRLTSPPTLKMEDHLNKIFILLRAQTSHDFSQYKLNTITRRVERRMALQQISQIDDYVRYLQHNSVEVEALFRDFLIGVTQFFRDPEAFAHFEAEAIPQILAGKSPGGMVRIWVPGCSTGEEAYSIAILLQEQIEKLKQSFKVQIFATDIDSQAIAIARAGIYPANIMADVSPERLDRFFNHDPNNNVYHIQKSIRDMLVFSEHDLVQAPPFSRLDLISCRNLLIYMSADLQKKLIPLFHYALNPDGFLFLGSSETVGEFIKLFSTIDRKWKLYQRVQEMPGTKYSVFDQFIPSPMSMRDAHRVLEERTGAIVKLPLREITEQTLLNEYAPVGVLVNRQGDILYIQGRTGRYLEPVPGEAAVNNILQMAREGLKRPLTTAMHKAAADQSVVQYPGLWVKTNGAFSVVDLTVRPMAAASDVPGTYLVILKEIVNSNMVTAVSLDPDSDRDRNLLSFDTNDRIEVLEQELRAKEEYLQTTLEEMESSNEELKSTNEELQSVNEELQSTNEELETSKEELQSVNEELSTVNAELQQRVADLSRANNDMNNLLAGTGVGTIFVDHDLHIQRFTPTVAQVINLIQTDIGRPVGHITSKLANYNRLETDTRAVLRDLIPQEIEVKTLTDNWYLLSIRPYRTLENVIEGAVITFVDITRIKKAEALQRLAAVVQDAHDAITLQDMQGKILAWNSAAERTYGWLEAEALAMNVRDRIPEDLRTQEIAQIKRLSEAEILKPYQTQRLTKAGHIVTIWLTATALINKSGEVYAIATTERRLPQQNEEQFIK